MNRGMVKFCFWGKRCLQNIGLALGGGLLYFAVYVIGDGDYSGGVGRMLLDAFQFYPLYAFMVGCILIGTLGIMWFQIYYSVIVSLSATRRETIEGIAVIQAATAAGIVGFMASFWALIPGGGTYLTLMPLLAGVIFLVASFSMVLGVVIMHWKGLGVFLAFILYVSCGMAFGITLGLPDGDMLGMIQRLAGNAVWPVLLTGSGILVYVLACVFAIAAMRRTEIRV